MAIEVGYFTLCVKDLEKGRRFFGRLFDWGFVGGSAGGWHIPDLQVPGGLRGGVESPGAYLYFRVPDVRAAADRVRALGGEVEGPHETPQGAHAECRDDQGTPFGLWQPAPGPER